MTEVPATPTLVTLSDTTPPLFLSSQSKVKKVLKGVGTGPVRKRPEVKDVEVPLL